MPKCLKPNLPVADGRSRHVSKNNGTRPHLDKIGTFQHIIDREDLTDQLKKLSLKILRHRNDYEGGCYPEQRMLASYMGVSRQSIQKMLKQLVSKGILVCAWSDTWTRYGRGPSHYFFLYDIHKLKTLVGVPAEVLNQWEVVMLGDSVRAILAAENHEK